MSVADRLASGGGLSVQEFADWAGVSRSLAYEELQSGALRSAKVGARRIVPAAAAIDWMNGRLKAA